MLDKVVIFCNMTKMMKMTAKTRWDWRATLVAKVL